MQLKQYKSMQTVGAKPMGYGKFCDMIGQPCEEEFIAKEGYLVEDQTRPANCKEYKGYVEWMPKDRFFELFSACEATHDFSDALMLAKSGRKIARAGWNGKNMFVFLVPRSTFKVNRPPLLGIYPEGKEIDYHAHLDMRTADGTIVPWLASQTDVLATDWVVVN